MQAPEDSPSADDSRPNLLCQLSNELLRLIASFCRQEDLPSLARTCHLLHGHAFPALYRTVSINGVKRMRLFGRSELRREMLKTVRSLRYTSRWHRDYGLPGRDMDMDTIDEMTSLRHLFIEWDWDEDNQHHSYHMLLPSVLAETLRTCTVSFKCFAEWPLEKAQCLFKHPTLRKLEIHWAKSMEGSLDAMDYGEHSTALEELNLIDCQFAPAHLTRMLSHPRALQYLQIWSALDSDDLWVETQFTSELYFWAMEVSVADAFKGLRFDMTHQGWVVVPTPGLHKVPSLRYLEIGPSHIELTTEVDDWYPAPEIDCPVETLLPPNIEVLKIGPFAEPYSVLQEIVERKAELVPSLRKIILSVHHRDAALAAHLKAAAEEETDARDYSQRSLEAIKDDFPTTDVKATFPSFHSLCQKSGIELLVVYEDTVRKEILREGAGPAVWEIAEQIA